jgi:hypothetical protein
MNTLTHLQRLESESIHIMREVISDSAEIRVNTVQTSAEQAADEIVAYVVKWSA